MMLSQKTLFRIVGLDGLGAATAPIPWRDLKPEMDSYLPDDLKSKISS